MNKSAQYNLLRYYLMQKLAAECDCGMDEESCDCEECSKKAFLGLFSSDPSPNEISIPDPFDSDDPDVEVEKSLKNLGFTDIQRHMFTPYVNPFTAKGPDGKYYTIDLDEDENVWRSKSISDMYGVDSVADLPDPYNRSEPGLVRYASKKADTSLLTASLLKWAASSPAWQRSEGKNPEGGLNAKGRASYNKATGGNLKPPVSAEAADKSPAKAKRRSSFCARSDGQRRMHNIDCSKTPDKRICLARKKWDC
jgi:hypothetical protein